MTTQTIGPVEKKLSELGAWIDRLGSPKEIATAIKKELNFARRGIDETQVQVALGRMEARDQLEEARERVLNALTTLERELRALDDMPWDELRREIHLEAADVEKDLRVAG